MKVLLTGISGYIGSRLVERLLAAGHQVCALARHPRRVEGRMGLQLVQGDLLDIQSLEKIPNDIDAAYYLVHSMKDSGEQFPEMEAASAKNFQERIGKTRAKQIVYLSGLSNVEHLSKHLASRKNVDAILRQGKVPVTTLMAGIIIGSESASFRIIRDLVEKLPVMIAPRWVKSLTQPIALEDVLDYLVLVLGNAQCIGKHFEIGGPEVFSYKELLLQFAQIRGLRRWIISVPVLTPKLSSYWLYFITKVDLSLAMSLVGSLKNNAVCKENRIRELFPKRLISFRTAVRQALE